MMTGIPDEFINTIISVHGKAGEEWLAEFDSLITYCINKWQLKLMPVKKLSYNFIAPVLLKGNSKAILKLGVPGPGINSEIAALKAFDGKGICKLLDSEFEKGILLLESVEPGEHLTIIKDDTNAIAITAGIIKQMQDAKPMSGYPFQTTDDWYNDLINLQDTFGNVQVPEYIFRNAVSAYKSIQSNPEGQRLLHGDLHQENILSTESGLWKAIDPKGVIAETACELIPFLMNNLERKDMASLTSVRINTFSDQLKIDETRIIQWAAFGSVLSVYWKIEDNLPVTPKDIMICKCFHEMTSKD